MKKIILLINFLLLHIYVNGQELQFGSSHVITLSDNPISYQSLGFPNSSPLLNKKGIEIETNGNTWVATKSNGLIYWNGTNWTLIKDTINNTSLPSDTIQSIKLDQNNDLWIASNFGISHRTATGYNNIAFNSSIGFPPCIINEIEQSGNILYLATTSGLISLNITNQIFTIYNHLNSNLINDSITSITIDNQGKLWLSSNLGYSIYDNGIFNSVTYLNSTLPNCSIYDIAFTSSDTILISATAGIIRKTNQQFESLDTTFFYKSLVHADFCSDSMNIDGSGSTMLNKKFDSRLVTDGDNIYLLANFGSFNQTVISIKSGEIKLYPFYYSGSANDFGNILTYHQDSLIFSNDVFINNAVHIYKFNKSKLDYYSNISSTTPPFAFTNFKNQNIPKSYKGSDEENLVGNMVTARILNHGDLHGIPSMQSPAYEVPFNSGKSTVYASSVWLGGHDSTGQIYSCAQTYRQANANDFWPGPLDTLGETDSIAYREFDHIWMARKSDIDEFRYQYAIGNVAAGIYQIPDFILNWPAFYNKPRFPQRLAPFIDINGDNEYNPYDGDYPDVKGEQMAWWIFNDVMPIKSQTYSPSMGVEIQAYSYAINCNNQLNNTRGLNFTTFYHYDLYNRSQQDYDSCFFGMWSNLQLGRSLDDLLGSNVKNNSFFIYNSDSLDELPEGYGSCPPVQNISFLKGPLAANNDGIDNNNDGIIDEINEDIGLSHFVHYFDNQPNTPYNLPLINEDYYGYLSGKWLNGSTITYGGNGNGSGNGATNTPSNYMYPGNTDTNFPNPWVMEIDTLSLRENMCGLGSVGPFDLPAGSMKSFDIAFITGPSNYGPGGMALNDSIVANIRNQFRSGTLDNFQGSMPSISGPAFTAALNTYSYTLPIQLNAGSTVIWNVQNGTIISGQGSNSINVLWGSIGAGTVSVELLNSNACKAVDTLHVKIGTVGLTQNIQDDFVRVYPNPTSSILNIETKDHKIALCEIRNLQGQIVSHQTYSQSIDIQNLTDGVYFILLLDNNQKVLSRKLVVKE